MFRIAFVEPRIPPNTGNAIRLAAATGCELHLVGPLAFDFSESRVRRAGLDYHDLASVTIHRDIEAAWQAWLPARVFAFTGRANRSYSDVEYAPGDVLMFGTEATGLPDSVLDDHRVTELVRIPMLPGLRSLNLSNAASIAVYEAWRQNGFTASADVAGSFT
jgi:tRNA (cytidine/uridine-2'-O-)-methyltransferase